METKIYRLVGIDTAMHMLRPGAKWEISNNHFTRWEDERPCPTMEEVNETIEKIRAFESSVNTIYTKAQLEEMGLRNAEIAKALGENEHMILEQ